MKKISDNIAVTVLMAVITFLLASCAIHVEKFEEGEKTRKTFAVGEFSSIEVNKGIDVEYIVGDTVSVVVEAGENVVDDMEVMTVRGRLTLSYGNTKGVKREYIALNEQPVKVKAFITGPSLEEVLINGSGKFDCEDVMNIESMRICVSGSGEVYIKNLVAGYLKGHVLGSGDITLDSAAAGLADFQIAGSGDVKATLQRTDNTNISIAGSGDVDLMLDNCNAAKVSIAGSGEVTLRGSVNTLEQSIAGSGEIDITKLKTGVPYEPVKE